MRHLQGVESKELRLLKQMHDFETHGKRAHYGATLSHWKISGTIDLDADALQALIKHYEDKEGTR